ncbi:hypothetical protein KY290_036240 [Solanum tuberosum]|uniref:Uncharacterized protein n=1 Tax=Solanum tuberosum TaxID=4113 RepID=A0ABQ7TSR1_SOLTU|nr:hypothetical protein KY290_036240 [Solanum tuberosum]
MQRSWILRCGYTCVMSINKEISYESLKWNVALPNIHRGQKCSLFLHWLAVALVRRRSIFCVKYVYDRAQGDAGKTTKDKDGAVLDETSA